jgi:ABC-2 type transport system ATP-binding protein
VPDAIALRGINKTFGPKRAVCDLDLSVPEGSLCGFLGPNGAGKTTTIRMIMSIIFPDNGEISVLDRKSAVESKDRIGYLPEERGVYRKMRAGEFLVFMAKLKGVDPGPAAKLAQEWLDRVDLGDCFRKRCEELSKGMQQKVQFIASILHDPDLIILDEPFSGLDPVNVRLLRDLIDEQHQSGKTIIFSTHVLHQAEQICERIFLINRGEKILDATLDEIREQFDPRTIVVRPTNGVFDPHGIAGVTHADQRNGEWELHIEEGANPREVMLHLMQSSDLRKVELRQPSLDDVFISLVSDARLNILGELEVADG